MANFDIGLLGFSPDDEEKYKEYMIRSLRPDMYDRTQQVGGVDLDWLNQMQDSMPEQQDQSELQIGKATEAEKPKVPKQQPVQGLLRNIPGGTQQQPVEQEQAEVTQQVNPINNQTQNTPQTQTASLAGGGSVLGGTGATSDAAEMAQSSEAANNDAAVAGKQLEAKKEQMGEETSQQAAELSQQEYERQKQESQGLESFLGGLLGLGLNMLIPENFFLKKAGIMGNKGSLLKKK